MLILSFYLFATGTAAGQNKLLWEIGKPDNNTSDFALGPGQYNQYLSKFPSDVLFVVGQSDTRQDWPYVQPGPVDVWAGSKSHTFTIVFGIKTAPTTGQAELVLDLADTHSTVPPKLELKINNVRFMREMPKGAGDASVSGEPTKGQEHRVVIQFLAQSLKEGNNTVMITSLNGSWILYDYVALTVPQSTDIGSVKPMNKLLEVSSQPFLLEQKDGKLYQPVTVSIFRVGDPVEATIIIGGVESAKQLLKPGRQIIETLVPAVNTPTSIEVDVKVEGQPPCKEKTTIKPVRKWKVYLLPHSHVDIGYTRVQTEVEQLHWKYLDQAIELSRNTAGYPSGSQFKWNTEVLWPVESYLKQASEDKQLRFIEAVKKGWIGLNALYGNELTGLCRQEELVRLLDFARQIRRRCNVAIDSAMISDVPGYTWGIVPVLAHSGVEYFSIGPNRDARIGYTLSVWADKPFYWMSPCGRYRVLCWVAGQGYSWFLEQPGLDERKFFDYLKNLETSDYPYDMVQARYTIGSDNGPPDPCLPGFVKQCNSKYAWPKLFIATTTEAFHEFEQRYASVLPTFTGDFTPYWEDGAASSALETALNRTSAERLVQAEALWAMLNPKHYPAKDFYAAWRNVVLYDEHTWGAHCSVSEPDSEFTNAQWKIKRNFALDADVQSRKLLNEALIGHQNTRSKVEAVDVLNTCSWARTDLVILPKDFQTVGDGVRDARNNLISAQRLSSGELAFVAKDVPPFGMKRFTINVGKAPQSGKAEAVGTKLSNGLMTLVVDEKTGAVTSIKWKELADELVNCTGGVGLNDYFYVAGANPKDAKRNGPVKVTVKDYGPLVASLLIESDAPGCKKLTSEVRVVDGLDWIDIINVVDKKRVYEKEGVHICFPFNVPDGVMRMDIPWAVVRPEADQLPGACKNWFTIQRWVDVSNKNYGVTWVTVDAPLVEVGSITAETPWLKTLMQSQTIYSYVMNNYWFTNYRAYQEGPTVFHFSIRPHKKFDSANASKFGIERSQPLVVVPIGRDTAIQDSVLKVQPAGVIVTAFKPSEDGQAKIVRLFNVGGKREQVTLIWTKPVPEPVWLSNFQEQEVSKVTGPIDMVPYEIVTLRIPLSDK